jgi:hypothetical protein
MIKSSRVTSHINLEQIVHITHKCLVAQVLLIIWESEKCDFILEHLTNLDWFQSVALALMWIAYWLIKRGGRRGNGVFCEWWMMNVRGRGKIWTSQSAFTLWLEHNCHINRGVAVHDFPDNGEVKSPEQSASARNCVVGDFIITFSRY